MITPLGQVLSGTFALRKMSHLYGFVPEISAIEQDLADMLTQHSAPKWYQQVPFSTCYCDFFLDMGCKIGTGRAIGIECDGLAYHKDQLRDFCRDALILGSGRLACIYHIEAWAIHKRQLDWMRILSELEPGLFTTHSLHLVQELGNCCDDITGFTLQKRSIRFLYRRTPELESVRRFLDFAEANQGITFPELVERARACQGAFALMPC